MISHYPDTIKNYNDVFIVFQLLTLYLSLLTDVSPQQLTVGLLLQPEATAQGRRDQEQPQQEAQRAPQRGAGHPSQPAALRAEHPQQARPAQHPAALCQLFTNQELLSRWVQTTNIGLS